MSDITRTVVAIQGNEVKREILGPSQDGHVLTWVNADGQWEAQPAIGGSAGGDLSGTYPDPTVISLTGIFASGTNTVSFPSTPVGNDITLLLNTVDTAHIINNLDLGTIRISTDCVSGNNGPIYIQSGTQPGSTSGSCHNVYIDAGSQNGTNQGTIYLLTGYGGQTDPDPSISLDATTASQDYHTAQIGLNCQQIHFNSSGIVYSQIATVNSNYTINNGRPNMFDYMILVDTTSGPITITLPTPTATGETYLVEDAGLAGVTNITVDGGGNNIDGNSTFVISTNFSGIKVVWTGTFWKIIARS